MNKQLNDSDYQLFYWPVLLLFAEQPLNLEC